MDSDAEAINFALYFEADAFAIIFEQSRDIFLGAKEAINLAL